MNHQTLYGNQKTLTRPARILLVEDVPDQAFFVSTVLSDYDCELTTVGDGTQAIEALSRDQFDLILLDLVLPEQSGLDVMIHLKCDESSDPTPVIITSSRNGNQPVLRLLDLSYEKFLQKPFSPRDLVAAIQTHLKSKRPKLRGTDA